MNIYEQNNSIYFNELKSLVNTTSRYANYLIHSKKYILDWINEQLPQLSDKFYTVSTKVYWILNGLIDFPKCQVCGKNDNYKFKNIGKDGYKKCCSIKCGYVISVKKIKNSLTSKTLEEYKQIYEKRKETCLKKYGVENANQSKIIQEKSKQTRFAKNNGKYFSDESIKKQLETTITRYGSTNNHEKIKTTLIEKYGVDNISKLDNIKEKKKQKCLEKYGVGCTFQANEVKEKSKKTCLEKYGVDNVFKLKSLHEKSTIGCKTKSYEKFILNCEYDEPCFSLEEYLKRESDQVLLKFKCKKCGRVFESRHEDGAHKHCQYCYPNLISELTSQKEKDLAAFIENDLKQPILKNVFNVIHPYELDIYIPEKKLAIEFDGLYWHSDKIKSEKYHLNKTELCEKQGIQLIHIFENEWIYKQNIVKSRIKNFLGIYDKVVYGRSCDICQVKPDESKYFQNENHIQGSVNSNINLGLFYDDKLVSLMTFGKTRFSKKYEYELLRFCNKLGYHIPGAASKLLKYFERNYNPKSLISYADRRWSKGNVYEKLGFKLDHKSMPNYWYWRDSLNLESRIKYQKHKLANILENFDPNKSEVENMKANSYNRIFDCGNLVYVKEY